MKQLIEKAIAALENHTEKTRPIERTSEVITELKEALKAPTQEPVAWRHSNTHCLYETRKDVPLADGDSFAEPLYAKPQPTQEPPVYREDFLSMAMECGADLTGKPDGSESITVVFTVEAWRKFDLAMQQRTEEIST